MIRSWIALLAAVALVALAAPVRADSAEVVASAGDRAVEEGRLGLVAFQQGRFDDALVRFAAAQALAPSPVFVLYAARSLRGLGKLVDARGRYAAVVAAPLAEDAPASWVKARGDASSELADLERRIPSIVIEARGAAPEAITFTVDGAAASAARPVEVDPGAHEIVAHAGTREVRQRVEVAEGEAQHVALTLPALTEPAPAPPRRGSLVPGAIVSIAGGVGIAVGSGLGAMALGRASEAKAMCTLPGGRCPAAQKTAILAGIRDATHLANASTAAFVAGSVLLVGGADLLWLRPGGRNASAKLSLTPAGIDAGFVF